MKKRNLKPNYLLTVALIIFAWLFAQIVDIAPELVKSANANQALPISPGELSVDVPGSVAFNADGSIIAMIGEDGAISLLDVVSGQPLWNEFDKQNDVVTGLVFSLDGNRLASVGTNAVNIWDVATGEIIKSFPVPSINAAISQVVFSPDGKWLAGVSLQTDMLLWNLETGTSRTVQVGQGDAVDKILFSPDSRFLVGAYNGQKPEIKVWDVAETRVHTSLPANSLLADMAFSPSGKVFASAGQDGVITLWDSVFSGVKRSIKTGETVTKIAFSPDSKVLASGSGGVDPNVQLWNPSTGKLVFTNPTNGSATVADLFFSPGGGLLASVGENHTISLWNVPTGELHNLLVGQVDLIAKAAFNNKHASLAAIGRDGQLIVWDLATGLEQQAFHLPILLNTPLAVVQTPLAPNLSLQTNSAGNSFLSTNNTAKPNGNSLSATNSNSAGNNSNAKKISNFKKLSRSTQKWKGVKTLALSQDGTETGVGTEDGTLRIFNKKGNQRWEIKGHHGSAIAGLVYRAKTKQWISAGRDTEIKTWDDATGNNLYTFHGLEHPARTVAVSADGRYIAAGGEETRIFLYDVETGKLSKIFSGHKDFVNGLAFSPDGRFMASAGAEGNVILWDVKAGMRLQTLLGHASEVNAVAFNPDSGLLASASQDSTVILWNVTTGQRIKTLSGHQASVRSVAFSPDGKTLVSAGEDTQILIWDAATGLLKKQFAGSAAAINALTFSPDGKLHIANENSEVSEFDPVTGSKIGTIVVPAATATPLSSRDEPLNLASGAIVRTASSQPVVQDALQPNKVSTLFNQLLDWVIPAANAAIPTPPGGPILVITSNCPTCSVFDNYYAEILRNEGFNEFDEVDISSVTATTLNNHDIAILAQMPLSTSQVQMLTDWVNAGGNLIAMRPDLQLASLLGLTSAGSTLTDSYLLVDTSKTPGNGIGVSGQPMQFHGVADRYTLNGATSVATLYSNWTTATTNPAVTLMNIGANGGHAAAFTYDLATSVVYMRQGNPAWAAQERDGFTPIRSDDKFFGNASGDPKADWVDLLNLVAVPQADEQQRLLANFIIQINLAKKPLPRFWYFPNGKKAAVIMTGDDHGNGGTGPRFDQFSAMSPTGCSVTNWECVRGTSYIYTEPGNLSNTQAAAYAAAGFEVGLHINTNCLDFNLNSGDSQNLETFYSQQIAGFQSSYPSLPALATERHHCIAWSDWVTAAQVMLNHGIRLDTSYYFWPPSWVQDRPGNFTGSAMPMRFSDLSGNLVDVYNVVSHMTDESGQTYPFTVNTLLDRAIGAEAYYGAYTINAHTDTAFLAPNDHTNENTIAIDTATSALNRSVPVVSSIQMLNWLDFRNSSSFGSVTMSGNVLRFSVIPPGTGSANVPNNGLQVLLPVQSAAGILTSLKLNTTSVPYTNTIIKGVSYAAFLAPTNATTGTYEATYSPDTIPPTVSSTSPATAATGVSLNSIITATFSEAINPNTIGGASFVLQDSGNNNVPASVSYNPTNQTVSLTPTNALAATTTYKVTIGAGITDLAGNPLGANYVWTFTTAALPCTLSCSSWSSSTLPGTLSVTDTGSVELGVKFQSDLAGAITGVRFYQNTLGTYTATLWNSSGQQLATTSYTTTTPGWQQANFSAAVLILPNTVYVASYHASNGGYAADSAPSSLSFANAGVDNAPIHLLKDGVSGGNGLYAYSSSTIFPTNTFQSSNYWVDVAFTTNTGPDTTPPTVNLTTPVAGATGVSSTNALTATFSEALDQTTITSASTPTFILQDAANATVAATVSYNTSTNTATLTPTAALTAGATYKATIKGGTTDPRVKDLAGNAMVANVTWTFTIATSGAPNCSNATSIWPANPTPQVIADPDTASVELGVKFRSNVDGFICGIRYYKGANNTGSHTGSLWNSAGGAALATVTFTNETTSGWQQAYFSSPVAITANTVYVASYHAPVGRYSADSNYFVNGVANGALYALNNIESGGNGVYLYGTGGLPANSFQSTNYWVDVLFTTNSGPDITPPTVTSTSPTAGATTLNFAAPVTATFSESVVATTVNTLTFTLTGPGGTQIPATVTYNSANNTATLTPSSALAASTSYTATITGGSSGVTDLAGNALVTNYTWTFSTGVDPCSSGGNPIVCENLKTGNPPSEWDLAQPNAGAASIQGFATDISVNRGQTVQFKIDTPSTNYHLDIYRMGYYNGNGARKVATVSPTAFPVQPICNSDSTGLIDCGNWTVTASWAVPATAVSGIYFAKAIRDDGTNAGLASHIFFIVRDDSSHSDVLFQTSDTTWQAYNNYGGNSFYMGSGPGTGGNAGGRAYKVSYNRPFNTRSVDSGQDWVFNAEYPMVRWLEANGYNVSYFTGVDSDRFGSLILNHKLFMSNGHDEYWSGQQRANVEAARDAGVNPVNLAFFSGNEVFWKTRWENSIDASGTPYRTLVCYKETHNFPNNPDPTNFWTGTWRDPRGTPPADGGLPENALMGPIFMVNDGASTNIKVPDTDGKMRFWRGTSIASLAPGATAILPTETLGYEWDVDLDNGFRPAGLVRLSTTVVPNAPILTDYGSTFAPGNANHALTLYKASSGALVFGAGTVQWAWGLDSNHDRTVVSTSVSMQQATVNLFADMSVQPGTLNAGLVPAIKSTDLTASTSAITAPLNGVNLALNAAITITGTATDTGGGVVGGVEVSVDGGVTWHPAAGREAWSFAWTTPATSQTTVIKTRAVDDSGNLEVAGVGVSVTIGTGGTADITPPSAPAGLTATSPSATQANLAWTASTDNVGVTGYRIERCQGVGCTSFVQIATSTTISFGDSGLTAGATYQYRVRATDAAGNLGAYSATVAVTTSDTTPPTAPTGLTATSPSAMQANLAWTASTDNVGVTGYRVERCQGAGCTAFIQVATPTTTSFGDTGLTAGATYQYRVRATDAAGNLGAYSATVAVTTSDTTPPTAPTGLTATSPSSTQVNLAWTASTDNVGVTGYRIERCQGVGCTSFVQIATSTTTSFANTGLLAGTTYQYRVRANDAAGNLSAYSTVVAVKTLDTTPPTAPTGLTATSPSNTQVNLAWTASTDNVGVTGYRIERCQGVGCTSFVQIATSTTTSFANTGLLAGATYQYRVRANDAAGNLSAYSTVVAVKTLDTTPPTAPTGLTAISPSSTQVNLAWTASTDNVGVTGYRVERCQPFLGTCFSGFTQIASLGIQTSFVDNGRTTRTTYQYRVRATDAAGNLSAYSSVVSVTTR